MATSTLGSGTLVLAGTTSGTTTVTATAVAGTTTLTLPAATDTLVGKATTDTLTNKTLTSPTLTGVATFAAGTAALPAITTSGDTNTGIWFPAADTIAFTEGGVESMRIDASGNLGLGVTPSNWDTIKAFQSGNGSFYGFSTTEMGLSQNMYYASGAYRYITSAVATTYRQISGVHSWHTAASGTIGDAISFTQAMTLDASGLLQVGLTGNTGGGRVDVLSNATSAYTARSASSGAGTTVKAVRSVDGGAANFANAQYDALSHAWILSNSTQAMTLDSSGNLLVGQTSVSTTTAGAALQQSQGSGKWAFNISGASSSSSEYAHYVYSTTAAAYRFLVDYAGTIYATSIVITAISDERLKENVRDINTGLDAIMALKPRRFDWKEGKGQDKKDVAGFIAQEFETVFPECVSTSMAGADGIEYKNINHETLIPTLVKAIQEQQALITQLTARITALEGA